MNIKFIDEKNLEKNLQRFSSKKVCAMVKANAYGHGLEEIVAFLCDKVEYFGVCCFEEALLVRRLCQTKILICAPVSRFLECKENNFEFIVEDIQSLEKVKKMHMLVFAHIKINSGMNRFGFGFDDKKTLSKVKKICKGEKIAGLCTHFSSLNDEGKAKKEYQNFLKAKNFLKFNCQIHFGGSDVIDFEFDFEMIRCGIGLYLQKGSQVMKIFSKVQKILNLKDGAVGYDGGYVVEKPCKIAVLPIGYADGLVKSFSGCFVEICNHKCPIIGNICMDACFALVTGIDVKVGDFANVLCDVFQVAQNANLSNYEVMTLFNNLRERK